MTEHATPIVDSDDDQPYGAEYCELAPDELHSIGWYAGADCSWCNERQDDE